MYNSLIIAVLTAYSSGIKAAFIRINATCRLKKVAWTYWRGLTAVSNPKDVFGVYCRRINAARIRMISLLPSPVQQSPAVGGKQFLLAGFVENSKV